MAKCHFTSVEVLTALRAYHCLTPIDNITYEGVIPAKSSNPVSSQALQSNGTINTAILYKDLVRESTNNTGQPFTEGKIPVIKLLRSITGLGLRESKDVIDNMYDKKAMWTQAMLEQELNNMGITTV